MKAEQAAMKAEMEAMKAQMEAGKLRAEQLEKALEVQKKKNVKLTRTNVALRREIAICRPVRKAATQPASPVHCRLFNRPCFHLLLNSASPSTPLSYQRRSDTGSDSDGGRGSDGEADYVGGPNQHLFKFLRLPPYQSIPPSAMPTVPQAKELTADGERR